MPSRRTVPVSERALIQRINRRLVPDRKQLRKTRGAAAKLNLGGYHIVKSNIVVDCSQGRRPERAWLEDLGRKLGVLGGWEHIE
jgi:hypothetical protein